MQIVFHIAPLADMHPVTLYRMLQLRTDVFVVEQDCAYPELDGRDLEAASRMVWAEAGDEVVATLRILRDAGDAGSQGSAGDEEAVVNDGRADEPTLRIGRVTVHQSQRGTGLARSLFTYALEQCAVLAPGLAIVLDAQEPLEGWYGSFGFVRTGPTFLEDDIPHVPMRKEKGSYGNRSRLSDLNRRPVLYEGTALPLS